MTKVMVMTMMGRVWLVCIAVLCLTARGDSLWAQAPQPVNHDLVINEIHYDPDVKTEAVEFIELYNSGSAAVDLSGWCLADAVSFTFPAGTRLASHAYLVVAENPTALQTKFSVASLGPWTGRLSSDGERIVLVDAAKRVVDRVTYQLGFPWPTVGDSPGYSIELINPSLDNDLGGNWRASVSTGGATSPGAQTVFGLTQVWKYNQAGTDLGTAWRATGYNDAAWPSGPGLLCVEDAASVTPKNTALTLGRTTYYFRAHFTYAGDPSAMMLLQFSCMIDDGAVFYLNGVELYRLGMTPDPASYGTLASRTVDNAVLEGPFTVPATGLVRGDNVVAVEVHQAGTSSSDIVFGMTLALASPGATTVLPSHGPTPGRVNSAYASNAPPAIRQVDHTPVQPASGQTVLIAAKVTDPNGVSAVLLAYQGVDPGAYIPVTLPNYPASAPNQTLANPDYEATARWLTVAMHDDGLDGDAQAGDDVYTVRMPASLQVHRRLIRYRITSQDRAGQTVRVPYADDPQQNFAYFVYDGVPAWKGALQPGSTDPSRAKVVTYGTDVMRSLPVYHLISRETDVTNTQNGAYDKTNPEYYCSGTLVYDGQVYDNVHYRIRGQASTGATAKKKWKFDFNRGHYFQARDDYGRPYRGRWDKMNVGTGCCPWWQYPHPGGWDVGTEGMVMNEVLGFRLYNMAGVPACRTNYFQLRVIDNAVEASASSQYDGDFWGLYLTIEQPDGAFLDEHGLPDGNVYRMDGDANKTHQAENQVANNSDVSTFTGALNGSPTAAWWAANVNLSNYYNSRAIGIAINDSDRRSGYNCIYYHNSQTNQWWMLPWDLDLTFEWATHYAVTAWESFRNALTLSNSPYLTPSKNRARELLDLLFGDDQTALLIDEIASVISTTSGISFVEANRAMWDYSPRANKKGQFYENNEFLKTKDWPGLVQYYKTFLTSTGLSKTASGQYGVYALVAEAADTAIPYTPTIRFIGGPGYAANDLYFLTSGFSDPQGPTTFGAVQWRIAEVQDPTSPLFGSQWPSPYEIQAAWTSAEITPYRSDIQIPAGAVEVGHAYRVRCRMKDSSGRWSHWSSPVQFVAGIALAGRPHLTLQVTEIMFNPPVSPSEDGWDTEDFEFIELMNTGTASVDLSGLRFTEGIEFAFSAGSVTQLSPGQYVLVAKNRAAFECRYGAALASRVAGEFSGKLSNSGERLVLKDLQTGVVADFEYDADWYGAADGQGMSLVLLDPGNAAGTQLSQKASWRPSSRWGGSPGGPDLP
jgi:hypothetical protein